MNIDEAISNAFSNLSRLNTKLYDHWIVVLYHPNGDMNDEEWNEQNLKLMEQDVMSMKSLFTI